MTLIAPTLQAFFTDRLTQQRQASPRTIAAYRDALRLLLGFVHHRTGNHPSISTGTTWTPPRSPRSSTTWKSNGRTASGRETFD
jgi:hypothetical protein